MVYKGLNNNLINYHDGRNNLRTAGLLLATGAVTLLALYAIVGVWSLLVFTAMAVWFYRMQANIDTATIMQRLGAQPLLSSYHPELYRIVEALRLRAGLEKPPRLYLLQAEMANAFTLGSRHDNAIGVSTALLRALNRRELTGVLAHEIAHIKNNDLKVLQISDLLTRFSGTMAFVAQLLVVFYLPIILFGGLFSFSALLGFIILVLAPVANRLLQSALSRTREYQADLVAVKLTEDAIGLASALKKLDNLSRSPFEFFFGRVRQQAQSHQELLMSHPVTQDRIDRLLEMSHIERAPVRKIPINLFSV